MKTEQEEERFFMIVNPRGVMHVVSEKLARERLRVVGWRLATKAEQRSYQDANGNQSPKKKLAQPFEPELLAEDALLSTSAVNAQVSRVEPVAITPVHDDDLKTTKVVGEKPAKVKTETVVTEKAPRKKKDTTPEGDAVNHEAGDGIAKG
jgi:hypothetical protein